MIDDTTLLGRYANEKSEAAFNDLVTRHLDMVYSAALRLMGGDTHRAQDVTQQVFAELARQAQKLSKHPVLVGWLYTTTRRIALQTSRGEIQRSRREQEAHAMTELLRQPHPEKDWDQLSKVLEDAMHDLGEKDRLAVLMRYFQNKPFNEVGVALGVNENAARMRVDRALDKLRGLLASRDVALSATGLGTALVANTVQAAPFGLAAVVSTSALAAGSTILTSTQAIAMTTLQKSLIVATVVASISIAIYQAKLVSDLREQVQALQEQKTLAAEQFQQLTRDRATATGQVASLRDENERLKGNTRELLRLRGEIGLLKRQTDPIIANNGTKGLIEWLEEYDTTTRSLTPEAQNAIRRMGANSLPELLDMLRSAGESLPIRGSTLRGIVGAFQVLGPVARSAVPALTELLNTSQAPPVRRTAALCLGAIGPDAQAAVLALIAATGGDKNINDTGMKLNSMNALTRIGGDTLPLVAAFAACLDDPSDTIRFEAAGYLQKFGSDAKSAVPQLLQVLNKPDEFPLVLKHAAIALEAIGPTTNNPAPALVKLLSNKDDSVRIYATNALRRLDPQAAARAGVN